MGLFDFLFGSDDSLDESLNQNWRETGDRIGRFVWGNVKLLFILWDYLRMSNKSSTFAADME